MLQSIVFDNEITIYWHHLSIQKQYCYEIYLNGKIIDKINKTHYEFFNLQCCTEYDIKVDSIVNEEKHNIGTIHVQTSNKKQKIDVTYPPYNAIGDGKTINTIAIQKALDDCQDNQYVYFPCGEYLSGALFVKSNCEIYIDKNATLKGSDIAKDYLPKIKSRFEGIECDCYASLINIGTLDRKNITCKNVIIRGGGKIIGGGRTLQDDIIEAENNRLRNYLFSLGDKINEYETSNTIAGRARGRLINISSSTNIVLSGITCFNGPAWNVHFIYSDNIKINRCLIGSKRVNNGDGCDPDSSHDCDIFDCDFSTTDDCIAIKSGKNPEGNTINLPAYNINIFDCRVQKGGGIAIGSEVSGGVRDINVWDCDCTYSTYGIKIKSAEKRGGYVEHINVFNCTLPSISIIATVGYNNDGKPANQYTKLRDFTFENNIITGQGFVFFYDNERQDEIKKYDLIPITIQGLGIADTNIENVNIKDCIITKPDCINIMEGEHFIGLNITNIVKN